MRKLVRHRCRKAIGASIVVLGLITFSAAPASATFESSDVWYAIGTSGGQTQCAKRTSSFLAEKINVAQARLRVTGFTGTFQGGGCGALLGLAGGWILQANVIQRSDGFVVLNTGYAANANGNSWAAAANPTIEWMAPGAFYQGVTYHRAAILGGWQDSGWPSNWIPVPA